VKISLLILILGILSLPAFAQGTELSNKLDLIRKSPYGLIPLLEGPGGPLLIIHGIDFAPHPEEWIAPFESLIASGKHAYLHKWTFKKGLEENRDLFLRSIEKLHAKYPKEKIVIFGYSAGGAISLLALDKLSGTPLMDHIYLHTIASPFFGFEAPSHAYVAAPFVGKGKIEIGIGAIKLMKNKSFKNCQHWVTTNCALDKNSCSGKKTNPQTGSLSGTSEMPCGNSEVSSFDDETHTSVIQRVLDQI
jgi:hypothetical protein